MSVELTKPLPAYLVQRYRGWKATTFDENQSWYSHLAQQGQHPRAMIISCCDSRLHLTSMFGADTGEAFIHRNIANFVPPFADDNALHGTSAAIEYAVTVLNVANLMIVGHSNCGGVAGAHQLCQGKKLEGSQFLEPWLNLLKPGYERAKKSSKSDVSLTQMEKEAVIVSLENLMTFPFVEARVKAQKLTLHGLWHDIGRGELHQYISETKAFEPL